MTEKTQKELLAETHKTVIELKTVLVGMKGTEDKGMVGDLKELSKNQRSMNGKVTKNRIAIAVLFTLMAGVAGADKVGLINLFGG